MNVPKLRFRSDSGLHFPEWKSTTLSEFLIPDFKETKKPQEKYLSIGVRSHCKGTFQKPNEDPSKNSMDKLYVVHEGDLILSITFAWEGAIAIAKSADHGGYVSHRFPTYKFKSEITSAQFFQYLFVQPKFRTTLELISPGGAGRNRVLSKNEFLKISCKLPAKNEQIKIANFLTAVDEKIIQLTQKCELLADYKKGIMQQIFSQELRFKDDEGQDFPEWKECEFGKVYEFIPTNSYSREMLTYEGGSIQNIHYGDIHTKYKSNFRLANENAPFLRSEVDVSKIKDSQFCRNRDIVIADASEDYADVGKAIEVIEVGSKRLVAGLHTYIARNMNNELALGFGGYLMQSSDVRSQIKVLATGVSVLSISKGNLAKVNIKLPCKPEQAKIASFLTTIDDKLTHTQDQLAAAKQYKQGLLQQMFV